MGLKLTLYSGDNNVQAPELKVPYWIDATGNPTSFSLAENRGKWIIINCFQHWCEGCHISGLPDLQRIAKAFVDNSNIEVICIQTVFEGFETNTQDRLRKTQLRYDLPITMGHDSGDPESSILPTTMSSFETGGTPWMIIIDPDGEITFSDFRIDVNYLIDLLIRETENR